MLTNEGGNFSLQGRFYSNGLSLSLANKGSTENLVGDANLHNPLRVLFRRWLSQAFVLSIPFW